MALIYQAEIQPTKAEMLKAFVPSQPWAAGVDTSTLETIGAFRFDDPDGEVGIETFLLRAADGAVLQVPVTYRGAELPDSRDALITTMQHSVLGQRWVYDGPHDPVYVAAALHAVMTGGRDALERIESDGVVTEREASVRVHGTGNSNTAVPPEGSLAVSDEPGHTRVQVPGVTLEIARIVRDGALDTLPIRLLATWHGQTEPAVLATLRAGG